MLARTSAECQTPGWKRELAAAYTRPDDLLADLGLGPMSTEPGKLAFTPFPFLVPRGYAARMVRGEARDPLLRQVLPVTDESEQRPGYSEDPVGDSRAVRAPGLLRKYRGRALILVTGACAIHCRYCFRRHFPYADNALGHDGDREAIHAIASDPGITEIILSGGDPLMRDDRHLADLLADLSRIGHLRRLRLHTRLPIVLPSRITRRLCRTLADNRLQTLVVVHANHARELSDDVRGAISALRSAGATLLNQSVLLRGVNDSAGTLVELSEALFECDVLPYYLHMLDPVAGAVHFEVPVEEARRLMYILHTRLPGYLVPRLVQETPDSDFKQLIG